MNFHTHRHNLDLVLSRGLSVCDFAIDDHAISDHKPIMFRVPINITLLDLPRLFVGLARSHQLLVLSFQLFLRRYTNLRLSL